MYDLTSYRDDGGLTRWVTWLLWADLAINAIAAASSIYEYQLVGRIGAGNFSSAEALMLDVESSDARQKTIGLFQFVVFAVTGIACLRWIHRASSNAHVLAGRALKVTPGWAVGWYFIPVLCLWKPFQAMSEIAQVSASAARRPMPDLGPWWTFWLIGNLSGSLAFNLQREAQEISTLMWGSAAWIASDLASLVADLCLIGIVKAISSMQLQGYDSRRMAPATGAAQPA